MDNKLIILLLAAASFCSAFDLRDYEPKQITTETSRESDILIKDKNTVYFASDRSGNFDVYKKDLLKETVTRLTYQPSNEYPLHFSKKILMRSDETDIFGNLYFLTEKGSQELVYSGIGEESSPMLHNKIIYFCSKGTLYSFLHGEKKAGKVKDNIGEKAVFLNDGNILFQSVPDVNGFNNLFITSPKDGAQQVQITFGQRIVTGFDADGSGAIIIFSAVTQDTNGDNRIDNEDNSALFRIDKDGDYYRDPIQLTPESYSSKKPGLSPDGRIYYISDRKGNDDVWSCGKEGIVPYLNDFYAQSDLSDRIFDMYRAQSLLAGITGGTGGTEYRELLTSALLSYNRTISFSNDDAERSAYVYFRIAEIYGLAGKHSSAESIYRILMSRYGESEKIYALSEVRRIETELKRKDIDESVYGYELDGYVRYLISLSEKLSDKDAVNTVLVKIGSLYTGTGRFSSADGYFLRSYTAADGSVNPESYFRHALSSMGEGSIKTSGLLIEIASVNARDRDARELYIQEYFSYAEKAGVSKDQLLGLSEMWKNAPELKAYVNLNAGNFAEVKDMFVSDPNNISLKRYSAQADTKLAVKLINEGFEDEAEGLLKYMVLNYRGFDHDLYSVLAGRMLSGIYLKRGASFARRNNHDNALLTYTVAFGLDKRNAEVIRGVADSYSRLGRIDGAITFFDKELNLNRNDPYINYALGYSYSLKATSGQSAKRDMTEAVRFLKRSLELDSSLKYSYLTLSFCYEAMHNIRLKEEAGKTERNILLKALDFITGPFRFVLETVNIIEDSDADYTDMALTLLGKGISLCSGDEDKELMLKMKLNLANNYYNMGEYARGQALSNYLDIMKQGYRFSSDRQEAIINERIGHCFFTSGNDEAEEYYDKALEIYKRLNDRQGELRVSMRTALLFLTRTDSEGDLIGGDDAYRKYSEIMLKLKSEDNTEAINLIKRNSAFAKLTDQEYYLSAGIVDEIFSGGKEFSDGRSGDNMIILNLIGLDIPVWKLDLVLGSQYAEGFQGKDELALLYSMQASNFQNVKEFEKVKNYLSEKAEIFRKKDNRLALSLIENRLGVIGYYTKDWKGSIRHFTNSKELCIKLELFSSALENENNILKAILSGFSEAGTGVPESAYADTTVFSLANRFAEPAEKAENKNLKGMLALSLYKKLKEGTPAEKFKSYSHLVNSVRMFSQADSVLALQVRQNEKKNRLSAAVLYNLSSALFESGETEKADKYFINGREAASQTQDRLIKWRYLFRAGDLEPDREKKFAYYQEAERILSEYLPSTADYELVRGWKDDIRPLYDRLIISCLERNDRFSAMNYAERYKNRIFLNYYSSRYLDYREQLHKIHIRKIRYNNDEIVRYRHRAEVLKNRDSERFASLIKEYEDQADFYEKELGDIYGQIKRSGDERLLQFVSIEDMDRDGVLDILGDYRALLSVYSLPDKDVCFYLSSGHMTSAFFSGGSLFDNFGPELEEVEHIFISPDTEGRSGEMADLNPAGVVPEHLTVTLLPSAQSLRTVSENANINYSEFKKASGADLASDDLSPAFENGGIIYFDRPAETDAINSLENAFTFGGKMIRVSDFLKYKVPAYAVVISGFEREPGSIAGLITANSLIFSGVQTVIMPHGKEGNSDMALLAEKLKEMSGEKDIASVIKENNIECTVFGLAGMDREAQRTFAQTNLRSSLLNAVRYYNSQVYEKAAVYFIQALAMARNTGDRQELNILKTLISSLSRMKDYRRAVNYGLELIAYTDKNSLQKELLLAYDSLSKDHFRNREYGKSAEYQYKIISHPGSGDAERTAAYDMLSVIYSYSGDFRKSIGYKKKYLETAGLTSSPGAESFSAELEGGQKELLFNSLRNIMVSYYRAGDTDSALVVYGMINDNIEIFEDVSASSYGELLESAGLCYFKKSAFSKAEELYIESLEYITDESRKASVYINLSDLYYYTDRLSSAAEYITKAEQGGAISEPDRMRMYNTRSLIEVKLDNIPAARTYSYKALEKTIASGDMFEESTARVNLARIMIMENDIEGARRNLARCLELSRSTNNIRAELSAEFYRGEIFINQLQRPDSALSRYRKCIRLSSDAGDNYFRSRAMLGAGTAFFFQNRPDSSEFYTLRSLASAEEFGFADVYFSAAARLSEIYWGTSDEKALNILGRMTERAIQTLISGESRLPADQFSLVRTAFERKVFLLLNSGDFDRCLEEIQAADILLSMNDIKHFRALAERSASKKIPDISVSLIRNMLLENEAIFVFVTFSGKARLIAITRSDVKLSEFPVTADMGTLVSKIGSKADILNLSRKVYQTIFSRDVLNLIQDKSSLIIYSSGQLKNFPFDALFDGKDYLVDRFNITETGRIFFRPESLNDTENIQSISFVNPFTAESELVFAERETVALSEVFRNTTPVKGMQATESLLRSPLLAEYNLVHLPVHSFILKRDSLSAAGKSSYIQLSADDYNDGKFSWGEIAEGNFAGKDIIMSGCETAGRTGEEYYSYFDLTSAFFESGARSVISSKWRTDDLAASVLMKRYFRYLAAGLGGSEALSTAKRDVRQYFDPHPYYWANFKIAVR